jgi:hypothetical protein
MPEVSDYLIWRGRITQVISCITGKDHAFNNTDFN